MLKNKPLPDSVLTQQKSPETRPHLSVTLLCCVGNHKIAQKLIKHLQYTNCNDQDMTLPETHLLSGWNWSVDLSCWCCNIWIWTHKLEWPCCRRDTPPKWHHGQTHTVPAQGRGWDIKVMFSLQIMKYHTFFFFFLSHACYAYLAQFHVETNYTLCYVTALWAYFIHHWMWGLMYSFQIYKSNGKSPALGMLGQNRAEPGGNSRRQLQGNGLFIMENLVCASDQWQ